MNARGWQSCLRGALAIAGAWCLAATAVQAQPGEPVLAKYRFVNGYSCPMDVYLLDENQEPPEEQYQATVPNIVYQDVGQGIKRVVRGEYGMWRWSSIRGRGSG